MPLIKILEKLGEIEENINTLINEQFDGFNKNNDIYFIREINLESMYKVKNLLRIIDTDVFNCILYYVIGNMRDYNLRLDETSPYISVISSWMQNVKDNITSAILFWNNVGKAIQQYV